MKKRTKIIIIVLSVLFCLLILTKPIFRQYRNTDTLINKIGCRLFEFNTISVKVENGIEINKIEIKKGDKRVFSSNRQRNKIGQKYGYNILSLYYKDLLISEIGHCRYNSWYTNDYIFVVSKQNNKINVKYEIKGPDNNNDSFQKMFIRDKNNKIERVEYFDNKGVLYNTEYKNKERERKKRKHYNEPINLNKVKNAFHKTSGVLSSGKSEEFCNPNNSYFFGMYFLIGSKGKPFGKLIIYIEDKSEHWQANNTNEKFAEINLKTNEVSVWDSICVGMKEKKLLDFIGDDYIKKDDLISVELGEYSASFVVKSDTLNELTIGKYCKK